MSVFGRSSANEMFAANNILSVQVRDLGVVRDTIWQK